MDTKMKRFTISVTPELENRLDEVKNNEYWEVSRNEMIQDLIVRGLQTLEQKEEKSDNE